MDENEMMNDRQDDADRTAAAGGRQAGFTLVELLVVLVILGLLAAIAVPRAVEYLGGARADSARLQMRSLESTLDLFKLDAGRYPSTEEGLMALVRDPGGLPRWRGPYVKAEENIMDPWGRPFTYRAPGDTGRPYDIVSLGADGQIGGEGEDADIDNQ